MANAVHNDGPQLGGSKVLHRQRLRISKACQPCRQRKIKCDGGSPGCNRCLVRGKTCTYSRDHVAAEQQTKRIARIANKKQADCIILNETSFGDPRSIEGASLLKTTESPFASEPLQSSEHSIEEQELDPGHHLAFYIAQGRFAGDLAATIDVRAGLAPNAALNLVPFVDAPLFGEITVRAIDSAVEATYELPPRAYADRLVGIYWQRVDPVEPILDRNRFGRDYEATYLGSITPDTDDNDIWFCILNIVFAMAVQRQESSPLHQRNDEGNRYFRRAWALLRLEVVLWKPGSLELVQCLMLMNRYLHCTENQQQTWITAGLALRLAQRICFQQSAEHSDEEPSHDRRLKRRVWLSCVGLDRCVSWSLGRTSAPSLVFPPRWIDFAGTNGDFTQDFSQDEPFKRGLEFYEINVQIQLAQTQTRNRLAARLGLPRLYQQDDYQTVAVQLDTCLNRWENSLPNDWKLPNLCGIQDRTMRMERYMLHCRILITRIFLYRPMLARLYSVKSHTAHTPESSYPPSFGDRLLKEGAGMCVEAAQSLTSLIVKTLEPDESMGLLPWWYRIYFLHIAGTNFLAAMLKTELFNPSVAQSWQDCTSALRAHEHLSTYVQQCLRSFETLSARVIEARCLNDDSNGNAQVEDGAFSFLVDDIFQDVNFDLNDLLFNTADSTVLY
ncbi:putative fungal-specific transcription factor [Thozetella sp. PMI_491]|nr:putative fungal-specific transcription factor [Thozetella sp. PMI_491]